MVGQVLLYLVEILIELVVWVVDETNCIWEPWIGNRVEEMKDVGRFRMTLSKSVEVVHITVPFSHVLVPSKISTWIVEPQISQSLFGLHPKSPHVSVLISLGIKSSICRASIPATLAFKLANKIPTRAIPYKVRNDLPRGVVVRPPVWPFKEGACDAIVIPVFIMGTNPLVTILLCHFSSLANDITKRNTGSTKLGT